MSTELEQLNAAIKNASRSLAGEITTLDLLLALMRNGGSEWNRVQLVLGGATGLRHAVGASAELAGGPPHSGIAVTHQVGEALKYASQLAKQYEYVELGPGLVAIALIADPASDAALAVDISSSSSFGDVLRVLQEQLLDGILNPSPIFPPRQTTSIEIDERTLRVGTRSYPLDTASAVVLCGLVEMSNEPDSIAVAELSEMLERLWIAPLASVDSIALAGLNDRPVADSLPLAEQLAHPEKPSASDLAAAIMLEPSDAVQQMLKWVGLSLGETQGLLRSGRRSWRPASGWAATASLLQIVTVLFILQSALRNESWILISVSPLAVLRYPIVSLPVRAVTIAIVAYLGGLLIALVALATGTGELLAASADRTRLSAIVGRQLSWIDTRRAAWRMSASDELLSMTPSQLWRLWRLTTKG